MYNAAAQLAFKGGSHLIFLRLTLGQSMACHAVRLNGCESETWGSSVCKSDGV